MSTIAPKPATTPIPVQLSEPEFTACILPHLSLPKRGPRCKLGYHRVFNLILSVLYTGMQWKCLPVPQDTHGKPAIHYTTVYKVFAKWSDDGSLEHAFIASVQHLADHNHLDCRLSNNFSRLTYKFSRVFEPLKAKNRPVPTHIFSVEQAAPFSHNQGCANSLFHNETKIYESGHNTIRKAHLHDDMKNYVAGP